MLNNAHHYVVPADAREQAWLESLIHADFAACHPGETLDDVKRRARFSKEDKGLLREWMAVAAARGVALTPAFAAAAE
jgi:23S rRNA C2498 (ribose-2'-O)-methylase RlmM